MAELEESGHKLRGCGLRVRCLYSQDCCVLSVAFSSSVKMVQRWDEGRGALASGVKCKAVPKDSKIKKSNILKQYFQKSKLEKKIVLSKISKF